MDCCITSIFGPGAVHRQGPVAGRGGFAGAVTRFTVLNVHAGRTAIKVA